MARRVLWEWASALQQVSLHSTSFGEPKIRSCARGLPMLRIRCYVTPLFGAYIADAHWGRFKTICWGLAITFIGHIILIIPAVPGVIEKKSAIGPFVIALIVMGFGSSSSHSILGEAKESRNGNVQVKHLSSGRGTIQA